jgi:hypothetical protein
MHNALGIFDIKRVKLKKKPICATFVVCLGESSKNRILQRAGFLVDHQKKKDRIARKNFPYKNANP